MTATHAPSDTGVLALRDGGSSRVELPLAAEKIRRWREECDVLVIGYGLAGASAALEAAERGLDVLLVDRFQGGGSSQQSGGVVWAGGGTPVQRECGLIDTPEATADYLRREVGGFVSDETVMRFATDGADTLAFLTRHGVNFSGPRAPKKTSYPASDYYLYFSDNATVPANRGPLPPVERGHRAKDPALVPGARIPPGKKPHGGFSEGADMGWHLMAAIKLAVSENPRIRVLRQARAERLVRDAGGAIVGAELRLLAPGSAAARLHAWAETRANKLTLQVLGLARPFVRLLTALERRAKPVTVKARRGVVIAAGGYVRNTALMKRFAAPYLKTLPIGCHGDDGAGIRLGVSAGGVADHMDRISAWRFINPPYSWTKGVVIGADGRRLTNEEQYGAHLTRAIYEKSDGRAWLVVDEAIWQAALAEIETGNLFAFQQFPVTQARKGAARGGTLAELAGKLGVPAAALEADVAAYTAAAAEGLSDPMGKSDSCRQPFGAGPFYAIDLAHKLPTSPVTSISTGGLRVDEVTSAVVDAAGRPIGGLYAVGRSAIGICSNNYLSGLSLSDGVWSGRRAARAIGERNA